MEKFTRKTIFIKKDLQVKFILFILLLNSVLNYWYVAAGN